MEEFLSVSLSYPTVIFTGLLAAVFLYWVLVIVGAMGIDVLDVDAGGHEGVAEAAVEGVADAAAEGVADAAAEGAADGVAHGADGSHGENLGLLGSVFYALRLRSVPATLVLSLVVLFGWILSWLGTRMLVHQLGLGPAWLMGTALLASSIIAAFLLTSLTVRPLASVIKVERRVSRRDLVGKVVRIDTSRVDGRFGVAKAENGGAGLIVQVRCDAADNGLNRGANALVVSYDQAREVYEVVPIDDPPSERSSRLG